MPYYAVIASKRYCSPPRLAYISRDRIRAQVLARRLPGPAQVIATETPPGFYKSRLVYAESGVGLRWQDAWALVPERVA